MCIRDRKKSALQVTEFSFQQLVSLIYQIKVEIGNPYNANNACYEFIVLRKPLSIILCHLNSESASTGFNKWGQSRSDQLVSASSSLLTITFLFELLIFDLDSFSTIQNITLHSFTFEINQISDQILSIDNGRKSTQHPNCDSVIWTSVVSPYSPQHPQIQSENHASNKEKTAGGS